MIITIREFRTKYGYSHIQQKIWRDREENPLPFNQERVNSTITYNVEAVEEWFESHNPKEEE